jgi:hypothetical protein
MILRRDIGLQSSSLCSKEHPLAFQAKVPACIELAINRLEIGSIARVR